MQSGREREKQGGEEKRKGKRKGVLLNENNLQKVAFVARKRESPLTVRTVMIIKDAIRFLSSSIFIALQIPFPCSSVVSRIIECFGALHSSAASCLFLILFLAKEGKNEPNNFLLLLLSN